MSITVSTLVERPDLEPLVTDPAFDGAWPQFIDEDRWTGLYYSYLSRWPEHVLLALDGETPVARAFTAPFAFPTKDRSQLPLDGWDAVIRWAHCDSDAGLHVNACSALEITIAPSRQGSGLASVVLGAVLANARRMGYPALFAPVRPSRKDSEPETPMTEYVKPLSIRRTSA
jgi:GNAT superfamily N-acetyltransferase